MSIFVAGQLTRQPGADPRTVTFVLVDVETTGLDPAQGARICEVAVVRMRGDGVVLDEYATLVDPQTPVPNPESHRITDADVTHAPTFAEIADDLLARLSGAIVVGHSLDYVDRFLSAEYDRLGVALPPVPGLCSLTTTRLHLDRPDHKLAEVANLITGEWPSALPSALGIARAMAATLASLVGAAPEPLHWRGLAPVALPGQPRHTPVTPRVVGLRKGTEGWLATLSARLPYTVDPPAPRPDGLSDYRALLARALTDGRIVGDEATNLAALVGRAGLTQATARQVHEEFLVVRRAHAESDGVVTAAELRELQRAAKELAATHLIMDLEEAAAANRARRGAPLRGWRILPVGDSAEVTGVVDLAVDHGATVAVKLTRTVRLVVTDPAADDTDPRIVRARELGVPVLSVAEAHPLLADAIAAATGGGQEAGTDEPTEVYDGPRWHEFWRVRELSPAEYHDQYGGTVIDPIPPAPVADTEEFPAGPAVGRSAPVLGGSHAKSGCAVVALLGGALLAGTIELVRHLVL
ncbi:exonuclease domain-containing protein [Micromonospora sp. WMMA1923]|uniref:exonuclease domain-containing protein n=1 Tax=Micromonospora sp. WMMA1923 TaxID=3404125 RepID=UPI003B935D69